MNKNILDSIININGCIFFALDNQYRYISFSNEHKFIMKKIWGVDIEVGVSIFEYIKNEDDKIKAQYNFDKALNGESIVLDEDYGDNSFYRTLWRNNYSPIFDDEQNVMGVLVFITELTEYVQLQDRFNELKIFENIINLVGVGVTLLDPNEENTPIIFANDSFCEITGYEKNEIIGKSYKFFKSKSKEDKSFKILKDTVKNQRKCSLELLNYKKDGTAYISLLSLTPIVDEKSKLVYYVGIHLDITQKIEEKKIKTIKNISSGLTHEINTALVSFSGNMDMIAYDIEDVKDENLRDELKSSLQKINQSKNRISKITDSLYYINRTTAQKKVEFNIYHSIYEAINYFGKKIDDISININGIDHKEFPKEETMILAERKSITHIWKILLENAIDILNEKRSGKAIDFKIKEYKHKVKIKVSDNGYGIDLDIRDKIFKPLVKGKKHKGVGISLSTVKTIIDMHNGKIDFKTGDKGTTFEINLKSH